MPQANGDFPKPGELLRQIHDPEDLKGLTPEQLPVLAKEIREYLVASVSRTGGHLGPNLGVVELTIALHRVFDSPEDALVFDTGHQAYVHKLLTGRQDFSKLRQKDGLSGYPSRAESSHDIVENSHASTALSWAYGIASAQRLDKNQNHVVAVIGDGALTGGMAWEALNNIATGDAQKLVIVVNDNGRSYAPTIGGLSNHLNMLRTDPRYEKTLSHVKQALMSAGRPGEAAYETLRSFKRGLKDFLAPQVMFEDLGLKYLGPIDGHNLEQLELTLKQARDFEAPVIVHVRTEKGRGFTPAEQDAADRFHAVGAIHPETGLPVAPSRFGWTSVFAEEMLTLARKNKRLVGVTAAMMAPVGLGPMAKEFPKRVFDVGIAEAHAATMCAGLAFGGYHPVFAVYATFLNRAFDQVLMDIALHQAPVTIVLDRAGATGDDGASHNGMWDLAMLRMIPGIKLAVPRDATTLRKALQKATSDDEGLTVIRYPKGAVPEDYSVIERGSDDVNSSFSLISFAHEDVKSEEDRAQNARIALVALGPLVKVAREAAMQLSEEGNVVEVIDPEWIYPIASDLVAYLGNFDHVITLEDGLLEGGYGSALRDSLSTNLDQKSMPSLSNLGIGSRFWQQQSRDDLWQASNLTVEKVIELVRQGLKS
ncbi:1-deoxy-D-xylulose-5-phosphate synthase [Boudabousia liubingyangii]|uniref:1-deoxy-D-xylulose-5-phosphate synthase n=1 Tax=Boudabousia liubingyangii TaxID=1921764 RepID=UPI00093D618C|nr:1-deoxy-D-xylulose-5-phosphate synthase [Boudabousia liubingyangii]OKL47733.1 1-deoxy-D-xylulose-5-phosphate synthase [Boudabousia liubingyangii]